MPKHDLQPPKHAESQQTPSTQRTLRHCESPEQGDPLPPFVTHAFMLQVYPATQSLSIAQLVLQAFVSQTQGAQSTVPASVHCPIPLHTSALSCTEPVHVWTPHMAELPYIRQAPPPSQESSVPQLAVPVSGQSL